MSGSEKKLSPRAAKRIGLVMMLLSAVALAFGGDQLLKGIEKRSEWNKTIAVVTNLEPTRGRRGRVNYTAWFSFLDPATNQSYRVKSKMASNPPAFRRGERVELLFPADHPEDAVANTLVEVYFWAIILGICGAILGVLGLALQRTKSEPTATAQAAETE